MGLGGGIFTVQNKILNGAYINFISKSKASATLSDRGVATMPLELDWGVDSAIFEVTPSDFQKNSLKIFGYPYTHKKMKGLRDLFMNIKTLYAYKLTSGGQKASNDFATARYGGTRGNDLKVVITANVDLPATFDVSLYMDSILVDEQFAVAKAEELLDNDYVIWKDTMTLAETAGTALKGGTNGSVDGTSHQTYLDKAESYSFNTMGAVVTDETTKSLYAAYTKRMRNQVGAKFQCVLYKKAANDEGVISVENEALNSTSEADLVYWVTGASAGCAVNKTLLNRKYDGEFEVDTDYTQTELETAMQSGKFMFHNVNGIVRVLADINSFTYGTEEKSVEHFGSNQIIRVLDQIANDIAAIFCDKYLGVVPNDAPGRVSLWNDIVKHHKELQKIRAIQEFDEDDVVVTQGDAKDSVVVDDAVNVVVGMAKLYQTIIVS